MNNTTMIQLIITVIVVYKYNDCYNKTMKYRSFMKMMELIASIGCVKDLLILQERTSTG